MWSTIWGVLFAVCLVVAGIAGYGYMNLNSEVQSLKNYNTILQENATSNADTYNKLNVQYKSLSDTYTKLLTDYTKMGLDYQKAVSDYNKLAAEYNKLLNK